MTENFKNIIHPDDNELLEYLNDDGYSIEPKYYVPTLPLILINGACGIGTGFSTDIPCFNPDDIKNRLLNLVEDEDCEIEKIKPWYKNFKGEINEVDDNKWTTHGIYKIDKNLVTITLISMDYPFQVQIKTFQIIFLTLFTQQYITV